MPQRSPHSWNSIGMLACWAFCVTVGFLILGAHDVRPGDRGSPPADWPTGSLFRLDRARPNLLIFLHPRCPCSRASLAELARIMSRCRGRVSAKAVVYRPDHVDEGWSRSGLGIEQALTDLPDVRMCYDRDGAAARLFGVSTSGHVLLFDEDGRRIFGGGITASRGDEGENCGSDEVAALILGPGGGRRQPLRPATPVFGCSIVEPDEIPGGALR